MKKNDMDMFIWLHKDPFNCFGKIIGRLKYKCWYFILKKGIIVLIRFNLVEYYWWK